MTKCSNISCGGFADSDAPVTEVEKQFGPMCPCCRDAIENDKRIRKAVCMVCNKIVMLFFAPKKDIPETTFCEECRVCGDINKESKLFSIN